MAKLPNFILDLSSSVGAKGAGTFDGKLTEYAKGMVRAADRAERCADLIRKGHLSAALYLARQEVDLIDLVKYWPPESHDKLLTQLPHPSFDAAPPYPERQHVQALLDAEQREDRLAKNLRGYRSAAMIRAPLQLRLKFLHELRKVDPHNPYWIEDAKELEPPRHKEIDRESKDAVAKGDLGSLGKLVEELDARWYVKIDSKIESYVRRHFAEMKQAADEARALAEAKRRAEQLEEERTAARGYLRQLTPQLCEAHFAWREADDQLREAIQANDPSRLQAAAQMRRSHVELGRSLYSRWKESAGILLPADPDLVESKVMAADAIAWLAEQDRLDDRGKEIRGNLVRLRDELANKAPSSAISPFYQWLEAIPAGDPIFLHDWTLQKELEALLDAARQKLREDAWRSIAVNSGVVAFVVACVVGIYFAGASIWHQSQVSAAAGERAEEVRHLLAEERLPEARRLISEMEEQQPEVAADPQMKQVLAELEAAESAEAQRLAEFGEKLAQLKQRPPLQLQESELAELEALAKSAAERSEVEQLRASLASANAAQTLELETAFNARLTGLEARSQGWGTTAGKQLPDLSSLAAFVAESNKLRDDLPRVNQELRSRAEAHFQHVANLERWVDLKRREEGALLQITAAVGNRAAYVASVERYIQDYPGPRADNFRRALAEATLWEGWEAWNPALVAINPVLEKRLDPASARELLALIEAAQAASPTSPTVASVAKIRPYLEAVSKQSTDIDSPLIAEVSRLFTGEAIVGLWIVRTKDGRRYYTHNPIDMNATSKSIGIEYLTGFGAGQHKPTRIDKADIAYQGKAPQSVLAEFYPQHRSRLGTVSWEEWHLSLIAGIVQDNHLDPLLKATFVRQIGLEGAKASEPLRLGLDRSLKSLEGINFAANWLDPDDKGGRDARDLAEKEMQIFAGQLPLIRKEIEGLSTSWCKPLTYPTQWAGWITHDEQGKPRCHVKPSPNAIRGSLWILLPNGLGGGRAQLVGQLQRDIAHLDPNSLGLLTEGRPVFLLPSISSSP